jgi:hypothetical protein
MNKQERMVALENVKRALAEARPYIDELNGYLYELVEESGLDREELSEDAEDALETLREFYIDLPVWDTVENMEYQCDIVLDDVEDMEEE